MATTITPKSSAAKSRNHRFEVRPPQASQVFTKTGYLLDESQPVVTRALAARKGTAVFVAHGMGQQIPFQTLDVIAQGLISQEVSPRQVTHKVATVEVEEEGQRERLQRLEMMLHDKAGTEHEVHVYEAYWAPLTEGRVTLRDTMAFVLYAGLNGLKNAKSRFQRWMFDDLFCFPTEVRILLYLLVALAVVGSLAVMNAVITLVVVARTAMGRNPHGLTDALFADLTTTFNAFFTFVALFGIALGACMFLARLASRGSRFTEDPKTLDDQFRAWRWPRRILAAITGLLLLAVLLATALAALSLPFLLYAHLGAPASPGGAEFWPVIAGAKLVDWLNDCFQPVLLKLLVLIASSFLAYWIIRILTRTVREIFGRNGLPFRQRVLTLVVAVLFAFFLGSMLLFALHLGRALTGGAPVPGGFSLIAAFKFWECERLQSGPIRTMLASSSWIFLIAVSAFVRKFLVQYLGDVAAYISSYRLDRYFELRTEIRDCVYRTMRAVYAHQEQDGSRYEKVIIVGHSLGSVIAYDMLNRLVVEDELAGKDSERYLDATSRTPLLLTFGSPLDKIAFLFALQGSKLTRVREALAAAVQPLICEDKFRPENWINIYSPCDIIGGPLDLYDTPTLNGEDESSQMNKKRVKNFIDPDALTPLAAHTEYWVNPLLYSILHTEAVK
jgi:hypothetical protein